MSTYPLFKRIPKFEELTNDLILDRFLEYVQEKGLELYPAQEEAILALFEGKNVILNTPTGSGKSLVALAMHFHSMAMGKRSYYTCPIKALVNEKFLSLCREFGPENVGMSTGDGSVNRDAMIMCCTAEILSNMALREGEQTPVDDVVMDEFHYYSDRERGVAWQIPLLTMPRTRFLLMSATLGEMDFFEKELTKNTSRPTEIVSSQDRPVPLTFDYRETPLHETVSELIEKGLAPVYLVCFTQREAAEEAQNLMSVDFLTKEAKKSILEALHGVDFSSPYGKEVQKFLKHGIGLHHAGLLPRYRILVERLAQTGLLKVICGTDTLGVGVNIPIRTVLFSKLCKYGGEKTSILSIRDFHQISGRAGRRGFDTEGRVVAQAPAHVIENKRMEEKAKTDPKKAKKLVRQKPPEKGFVHWADDTFQKLRNGKPEALVSRFQVSHGMLLNVLSRKGDDGCVALRSLIRASHDTDAQKKKHRRLAWQYFRSLLDRKIIGFGDDGRVVVNVELQEDFSLNHALSLYLLDTLNLLDPMSETFALDCLTLVESILESPDLILRKQLDRAKTLKMRELKEQGMEFDQRIEELDKVEYPKPMRDFIYDTFNKFADVHPWVGHENIRPKSIAREMYETYQSFAEYVREYELQRAEGVLLRYLSDVYRALVQTVPSAIKNDEFDAITEYFGAIVRSVDASLIEEWERLRDPSRAARVVAAASAAPVEDGWSDSRLVRIKVMNEVFRFIRAIAIGDFAAAVENLTALSEGRGGASDVASAAGGVGFAAGGGAVGGGGPVASVGGGAAVGAVDRDGEPWTELRLKKVGEAFAASGHTGVRTDHAARLGNLTHLVKDGSIWTIEQKLCDNEGDLDWQAVFEFDLERSRRAEGGGRVVMKLLALGPVVETGG